MRKFLAGLAVLFLWSGAAPAVPPTGPEQLFTARDLFDLEAADDPQISPDGRWIAYVRRSGDIMTDRFRRSIWLVDTAHRPADAARAGDASPAALVPDRRPPRLHRRRRWRPPAALRALDGSRAKRCRITGLGYAPNSVAWSPDGRQLAYAMFVPDEGQRLGPPQQRPEGAQWAEPLQVITAVTYRADGAGYLRAGYDQLFLVSSEGGAPRQLSYGPYNNGGPLELDAATGARSLFSGNRSPNWEREGFNTEIYALDIASQPDHRAHHPRRPGQRAGGVARRPADRLYRL